jgi:hypothetical protein
LTELRSGLFYFRWKNVRKLPFLVQSIWMILCFHLSSVESRTIFKGTSYTPEPHPVATTASIRRTPDALDARSLLYQRQLCTSSTGPSIGVPCHCHALPVIKRATSACHHLPLKRRVVPAVSALLSQSQTTEAARHSPTPTQSLAALRRATSHHHPALRPWPPRQREHCRRCFSLPSRQLVLSSSPRQGAARCRRSMFSATRRLMSATTTTCRAAPCRGPTSRTTASISPRRDPPAGSATATTASTSWVRDDELHFWLQIEPTQAFRLLCCRDELEHHRSCSPLIN